ncbi:MAG: DNA gyrase inhibitor YacG [Candidatus Liberibacter europaeus]|uniref:DNA gyrase inhibitor YacG n=1 Tax=Candidatus Liberibacter europaeus TaxID=744859 RepID=A0A2T4VYW6_9HYPH|nr:DNA gyrase inhibitor YacG [Candidatus Liberibacter europaeus]PTL86966.1 MAG: DNA gyrase inhibitor YacG [Candidatus Liberibacter europaeus]
MKHICPECGDNSTGGFYPFCSLHCRSIDLSRWLSDEYKIAGDTVDMAVEDIEKDN